VRYKRSSGGKVSREGKQLIKGRLAPVRNRPRCGAFVILGRGSASKEALLARAIFLPGRKRERYFGANVPTPALLAVVQVVRPRAQARFVACVRADRRPALRGQLTFVAEYFFAFA
jgi:hypothetical protein